MKQEARDFSHVRFTEHPEIDRNIVLANVKSMSVFLKMLREKHNSMEKYLLDIGIIGDEIQRLKNKLTIVG